MVSNAVKRDRWQQPPPTRLVIVDASDLSRNGILMLLTRANRPPERVFADLPTCLAYLEVHRVDILLLDDALPPLTEIEHVLDQLKERFPAMLVIVLSETLSPHRVQRVITSGAKGFIYKQDRLETTLLDGIDTVRSGYIYISPKASVLPYNRLSIKPYQLNGTDMTVLRLMATGYTVGEIAKHLAVVDRTIYRIRNKLREALDVRTNEQIIAAAREQGLI